MRSTNINFKRGILFLTPFMKQWRGKLSLVGPEEICVLLFLLRYLSVLLWIAFLAGMLKDGL